MRDLSESFWESHYKTKNTGWDLGAVSPPLKNYFDQLTDKEMRILIPGGGNSYEAEYLHHQGFKNVFVVDLSETALQNLKSRVPSFPTKNLIHKNFFDLELSFDRIIEQTFFCAIDPKLRSAYAEKASHLLIETGKIAGLLFNQSCNKDTPPFGGNKTEYLKIFEPYFKILIMEITSNSHHTREGKELFFMLQKKT